MSRTGPPPYSVPRADARPREDPTAGGGRVVPIAAIFQRRTSIPDDGYESGLEAKEEGNMVTRQQREGKRRKRETRNSTDKNGAAKQG